MRKGLRAMRRIEYSGGDTVQTHNIGRIGGTPYNKIGTESHTDRYTDGHFGY